MKKKTKVIIGILLVIAIIGGVYYKFITNTVNTNSPNNMNSITNAKTNEEAATERIVMVNGKLYYDTGKESTIDARCGNSDGRITSNIEANKIPVQNDQANFEGNYEYQYGSSNIIELKIDNKWYVFKEDDGNKQKVIDGKSEIVSALSLDDKIQENTIWCGTFQLIWNDLKNDLAKQDIVFNPQLKVVENLNKETFTVNDLSDKYFYKKIGTPSIALKKEIEKAIKEKFNEKSDILDDFQWESRDPKDYFLYTMLKKEFKFEKAFEELETGKFGNYENVKYFGIKSSSEGDELRNQVTVLYYNSKNDFAIKLKTTQEDEVILSKNPNGESFNEIYQNIIEKSNNYNGNKKIQEGELVKIPNLKIDQKVEFTGIENRPFLFSNGDCYSIEKALQTIKFELDNTGGKIKSEAGIMLKCESAVIPSEIREFSLDDTFAVFLIESGKDKPYFAGKINDVTKFQ